eukprot:7144404-Pyramimonas_sp.AAC.1
MTSLKHGPATAALSVLPSSVATAEHSKTPSFSCAHSWSPTPSKTVTKAPFALPAGASVTTWRLPRWAS